MKKLAVLFAASSLCLISSQSFSFTSVTLSEKELIKIVPQENALLSISYNENKTFILTNNTENKINVELIDIEGNAAITNFHSLIMPGDSKEYTIEGESKELVGTTMTIKVYSENKQIEIASTLPQFIDEEVPIDLPSDQPSTKIDLDITPVKVEKSEPYTKVTENQEVYENNESEQTIQNPIKVTNPPEENSQGQSEKPTNPSNSESIQVIEQNSNIGQPVSSSGQESSTTESTSTTDLQVNN